ncbi:ATP-dependent Clp protease ATP-binding subunit ClpC, partial [bacterium]|nr:ATP-dependent Clp protease ATP-binding subunit ClpC [bacterium]
ILIIDKKDIADYISVTTDIPAADLQIDEFTILGNLSKKLNRKVIGQRQGVKKVCNSLKRSRVGICSIDKPICTFLFLGPTGVGKSYLARILGEDMFNSNCFKQFDMSEYVESHSISKLIGAPPGYVGHGEGGILTEYVRKNPHCVLLFDEIEKAHPDVIQVFLQLFEYGIVTDSDGLEVNFKNTIIIMTSNIGAEKAKKNTLGFSTTTDMVDDRVLGELKKQFRPEFINRIDEVVVFSSLDNNKLKKICDLLLKDVKRLFRKNNNTILDIDDNIIDYLLNSNEEPDYGARPLKRLIMSYLESPLADFIIKNKIQNAKKIKCYLKGKKISFELIQ